MWLCRHYEHYFVALEETRVHLEALGVPAKKVTVSGSRSTRSSPAEGQGRDAHEVRAGPDRTTILVSAGGFGVGPIETLMTSLCGLEHPAQVVAICGRNEELKARLDARRPGSRPTPG